MRAITVFLLLVSACVALAQPENAQLRRQLEQVYAKWARLAKAGNANGLLNMLHPSFVAVDENGKRTTYAEFKDVMKSLKGKVKDIRCQIKIDHVRDHGEEAVAWVTMTESMKINENGKWVPWSHRIRFAETLRRTPNGWKFVYSQALPENAKWE